MLIDESIFVHDTSVNSPAKDKNIRTKMNIKNAMDDHYIVRSCVTLYGCEAVARPQIPLQAPCRGAAPFGSLQTIHPLAREVSYALESFQEQNLWETQIILHHNSSRPIWLPNAKHSL